MRRAGHPLLTGALFLVMMAAPAAAEVGLQGRLTLGAGWDSNPPLPSAGRGLVFTDVWPELLLRVETGRFSLSLSYTFLATCYFYRPVIWTLGHRVELSAVAVLSARTLLELSASALDASLLNYAVIGASDAGTIGAAPLGTTRVLAVRAGESVLSDVSPRWRLAESLTFTALVPRGDNRIPESYALDLLGSIERRFRRDALAALLRVGALRYLELREVTPDVGATTTVTSPDRELILVALLLRWRHDFNAILSSELEAGPVLIVRGGGWRFGDEPILVHPVGSAAIGVVRPEGQLELRVIHEVQPNAFVGATFVNTRASIRGSMPLPAPALHLSIAATAGYQHGQLLGARTSLDTWLADVTLTWSPRPAWQLFARYQFIDQLGPAAGIGPAALPVEASFVRHVVLVGLSVAWPPLDRMRALLRPSARGARADSGDAPGAP